MQQLVDRAGRYRRVVVALGLTPIPLLIMGADTLRWTGVDRVGLGFSSAHLLLAAICLWLARDLVANASLIPEGSTSSISGVALIGALALFGILRPASLSAVPGSRLAGLTSVLVVVGGLLVLAIADRLDDDLISIAGRWILSFGALVVGSISLVDATWLIGRHSTYGTGLAMLGLLLLATAYFELRLLRRGLALAGLARR